MAGLPKRIEHRPFSIRIQPQAVYAVKGLIGDRSEGDNAMIGLKDNRETAKLYRFLKRLR